MSNLCDICDKFPFHVYDKRLSPVVPCTLILLAIFAKNLKVRQAPVSLSQIPPALQLQVSLHSTPNVPYKQSEN